MPFDPNTPRSRDEVLLQAIVSGDSSMMGDPRDREEEFVKAIADKETLPDYSEASNGDVLQIGTDGPEWGEVPNELPAIAAGDAGKVLKVNADETGAEWGQSTSKKYYRHIVTLTDASVSPIYRVSILIISDRSTAYDLNALKTYLYNLGINNESNAYPAVCSSVVNGGINIIRAIVYTLGSIKSIGERYIYDSTNQNLKWGAAVDVTFGNLESDKFNEI